MYTSIRHSPDYVHYSYEHSDMVPAYIATGFIVILSVYAYIQLHSLVWRLFNGKAK